MNYLDPFSFLGSTAGKLVADSWTALMLGLWNAGLWLLHLALSLVDGLLTPDLSGDGPGAGAYRVSLWLALALVFILALVQIGLAVIRRDGRVLARAGIGLAQFVAVWAGWLAYGITVVTGSSGLANAMMDSLLGVNSLSAWKPWEPFTPSDISDGTIATVLGIMGIFLVLAAIGHLLAILARAAALIVLAATTPIASAGLVSDLGQAWHAIQEQPGAVGGADLVTLQHRPRGGLQPHPGVDLAVGDADRLPRHRGPVAEQQAGVEDLNPGQADRGINVRQDRVVLAGGRVTAPSVTTMHRVTDRGEHDWFVGGAGRGQGALHRRRAGRRPRAA